MTDDKTKDESAHLRFDYNLTECKALIEKIPEKIAIMETKEGFTELVMGGNGLYVLISNDYFLDLNIDIHAHLEK